jgi:hypothetical protein
LQPLERCAALRIDYWVSRRTTSKQSKATRSICGHDD